MKAWHVPFPKPTWKTGFGHCGLREPATTEKSNFWGPNFDDLYLWQFSTKRVASGCIRQVFFYILTSNINIRNRWPTGSGNPECPESIFFTGILPVYSGNPIMRHIKLHEIERYDHLRPFQLPPVQPGHSGIDYQWFWKCPPEGHW